MKKIRERDVEAYGVKRFKAIGGEVRKLKWIGRRGAPDRVLMWKGHTIWIEFKAPGCVPDAHQLREHKRMRLMGQRVYVLDTFKAVDAAIADLELLCHA